MACKTCKQKTVQTITDVNQVPSDENNKEEKKFTFLSVSLGIVMFAASIVLIPIMIPAMIVLFFNHFVLQRSTLNIGKYIQQIKASKEFSKESKIKNRFEMKAKFKKSKEKE